MGTIILSQLLLLPGLLFFGRDYLVDDLLFGLVAVGVLVLLDVGDLQGLILVTVAVAVLLALDQFDQRDVLGELGNIVALEVDHNVILGTLEPVLVLVLDEEGIETALAVCVPAGREESRHVVGTVLAVAERTLEIAFHGVFREDAVIIMNR